MDQKAFNFEFATATRIVFGAGVFASAGEYAAGMGERALVFTGVGFERAQPLVEMLEAANIVPTVFEVPGEPTVSSAQAGVELARASACDLVIGFGGGSAIDTGKAVSALFTNPGETLSYLEVVGDGMPLTVPPAPFIAIPTTAGTGAEVTRNAVLGVPEQRVKVSLRSPLMLPDLALVDPELTYSLPPYLTANTGLDALTQLIEPFVSIFANPLTDAICLEGIRHAAWSLPRAYAHGDDPEARQGMALASLFGGLALANAKLGAVHGFAGPFGGMFAAPHGAVCARLLPFVFDVNYRALSEREPHNPLLARFTEAARVLTGNIQATAGDGSKWLAGLCAEFQITPLSAYGFQESHFPDLIEKARHSSSMKGNPIKLTDAELAEILTKAL
jgi:alcohol dehydrogenase class IV